LEIAIGFGDGGGGQFFRFVVAFGAPGYIVRVAEGVDVDYIYVGWGKEEVLYRLGDLLAGWRKLGRRGCTEVMMCQGSRKQMDMKIQRK
jgi:hypothetical protein